MTRIVMNVYSFVIGDADAWNHAVRSFHGERHRITRACNFALESAMLSL